MTSPVLHHPHSQAQQTPHSVQAEQALLGTLLLDNSKWEAVVSRVRRQDLFLREHQLIFDAIGEQLSRALPADLVTVAEQLEATDAIDEAGGLPYLGKLASDVPHTSNLDGYVAIVIEHSASRALLRLSENIQRGVAARKKTGTNELADQIRDDLEHITTRLSARRTGLVPASEGLKRLINDIQKRWEAGGSLPGLPTGYAELDEILGGLQRGSLVVIAGRPAMGKTTLGMNIALNVAKRHQTAVFSLEMPEAQLLVRAIASQASVDLKCLQEGTLESDTFTRITAVIAAITKSKLEIDDGSIQTARDIHDKARKRFRDPEAHGVVLVDYLGLVMADGENQNVRTANVSRALKALAKELNVTVIALAQLNRTLEQRNNKRPMMADLRDSGAIEQDADQILFIYRDEVYNPDTPNKNIAEVIVAKNRNGRTGTIELAFEGRYNRFSPLRRNA